MQEKNCFSIWKMMISFCMALFIFITYSISSSAATGKDGNLEFTIRNSGSPMLYLDFWNNISVDGSDRDTVSVPYVWRGSNPFQFFMRSPSSDDTNYYYVSGNLYVTLNFTLNSVPTGVTMSGAAPRVFIDDSSLPDGITVFPSSPTGTASQFSVNMYFRFDNVLCRYTIGGGFTLGLITSGYGKVNNYGSSYGNIGYTVNIASDYVESLTYAEYPTDMNYTYKYFYNIFNSQNNNLNTVNSKLTDIYSRLGNEQTAGTVNYNIVDRANRIIQELYTLRQNDNANSQAQINAGNKNSQDEITNANKNADDIMHSYDSGSQEDKNKEFDSSQKELQEVEDSLFTSAADAFGGLDLKDYSFSKFTAMANAFTFVSGFMQSLYIKGGDFALIVSIGLVVMIASKVIGLYRFSTGGDK